MQLEHSFTIPAGIDRAWDALLDLERVAPCLPGARIESVDDGVHHGAIDVKVGPIALTYRGTAEFTETDAEAHRAVLAARTKEARGSGQANATITAHLSAASPEATEVRVLTDLDITGRPAQFGTGVLAEVGGRLLGQFADRMAVELARPAGETTGSRPVPDQAAGEDRADMLKLVAWPLLKRAALPLAGILGIAVGVIVWRSLRRGGRG